MFTDSNVFAVILLMNASLGIPAAIRTLIVTPTRTKVACSTHKTKQGERCQPREPFGRIRCDRNFSFLWTDEHISTFGSVFNQWNETISLLGRMAHQYRHCWLHWHGERRASPRRERLLVCYDLLCWPRQHLLFSVVLPLLEQLKRQVREVRVQGGHLSFQLLKPR